MIENPDQLTKLINLGVYVIGVRDAQRRNAFTASWVMQVSFDPLLLALSINPSHYSYPILKAGGVCAINVLGEHQFHVAEHFGRSEPDKMDGFGWFSARTGAPVLADGLAFFDCSVSHYCDAGDHMLAVCKVLQAAKLNNGQPLCYAQTGDLDGSSELY